MKRQVGYVSPELNFQPWGRVGRAIQFVRGFYPTWDEAYCERLLTALPTSARTRGSGRCRSARASSSRCVLALSWRPKLLVLDEPTVGLDAISKQQVFAELLAAVQDEDRTVFISSHGITDLERFADHVGMIKNGRLLFEGADRGSGRAVPDGRLRRRRRHRARRRTRAFSCSGSEAGDGACCSIVQRAVAGMAEARGARRSPTHPCHARRAVRRAGARLTWSGV